MLFSVKRYKKFVDFYMNIYYTMVNIFYKVNCQQVWDVFGRGLIDV